MKFSMFMDRFSDWISQYYGLNKIPVQLTWLDQRRLQTHRQWENCITFHNRREYYRPLSQSSNRIRRIIHYINNAIRHTFLSKTIPYVNIMFYELSLFVPNTSLVFALKEPNIQWNIQHKMEISVKCFPKLIKC